MRTLLSVLALALTSTAALAQNVTSNGLPTSTIQCDKVAVVAGVAGANMVKIVSLSASRPTFVCSVNLSSTGVAIGVIKSGTNTTNPCDTSTTTITGAFNFVAGTNVVMGSNLGFLFKVAAGLDVCILTTTTAIGGTFTYAQ